MKKRIAAIATLFVVIATIGALWAYSPKKQNVSSLLLRNIEALTQDESDSGCKWKNIQCPWPDSGGYGVCIKVGDGNSCSCGDATHNPLPC